MRKILSLLLLISLLAGIFAGCAPKETSARPMQTLEDYKNATIGVITGSARENTVKETSIIFHP